MGSRAPLKKLIQIHVFFALRNILWTIHLAIVTFRNILQTTHPPLLRYVICEQPLRVATLSDFGKFQNSLRKLVEFAYLYQLKNIISTLLKYETEAPLEGCQGCHLTPLKF